MPIDLATLLDDVETLHRMIGNLVAARDSERAETVAEIDRLRRIVKSLQRSQFGQRSERLDEDQLQLGLEELDGDIARAEAALPDAPVRQTRPAGRPEGRLSLPDHLPREDTMLDIGTDTCPCCGGAIHLIGETVSEMLDHVPARLRVLRIRRPRYGCRSRGAIHQVDGYAGFEQLTARGDIVLAACWAHARRKFYDVHQATDSPIAAGVLTRIAGLYAIEQDIRGQSAESRKRVRAERSRPAG